MKKTAGRLFPVLALLLLLLTAGCGGPKGAEAEGSQEESQKESSAPLVLEETVQTTPSSEETIIEENKLPWMSANYKKGGPIIESYLSSTRNGNIQYVSISEEGLALGRGGAVNDPTITWQPVMQKPLFEEREFDMDIFYDDKLVHDVPDGMQEMELLEFFEDFQVERMYRVNYPSGGISGYSILLDQEGNMALIYRPGKIEGWLLPLEKVL